MRGALLITGAVLELVGILALAAPDLLPWGRRLAMWLGPRARRIENWLRRRLHLPARPVVHRASVGSVITLGGNVRMVVSVSETATLEEKVAFLLRRDRDTQGRLDDFGEKLQAVEKHVDENAAELRGAMEEHVAESITSAVEADRALRVLGAISLVAGLGCVTVASFL